MNELLRKIDKQEYNETRFVIDKNKITRSDLDTLRLYAEQYDGAGYPGLMRPLGIFETILSRYE